jgi:amino acid permease
MPLELDDGPQPEGYGAGRAATILVAECVGTGVLALPYVASVLGTGPFLLFVAVQVALNLYAGELLATAAEMSERRTNYEACRSTTSALWDFVDDADNIDWDTGEPTSPTTRPRDMLELAQGLDAGRPLRALVACAWYGNLVLILAQYLVVMARSLRVAFPLPGCAVVESLLIAALTAWFIAQLPTLDALGKGAAQLSFASVLAILAICARHTPTGPPPVVAQDASAAAVAASLTMITFAMITSKLFLNVRREMRDPREGRKMLRYGIAAFTCVYVVVVFLSGPEPPRFLLDAVHHGTDGRIAAGLLFAHVAVSYAINQNVLARTLERYLGHTLSRRGWALMTAALTLSSLLIAVLVPVFSDLVAVIGALTSGPLGFAVPALLFDLATRESDVKRRRKGVISLVLFTVVLTIAGTTGAIVRTVKDWEAQERSAPGVRGFFCAEQASSMS